MLPNCANVYVWKDETLANLDKTSQVWLLHKLEDLARGRTLILTTHDLRFTANFDSIIVLESGCLSGQGNHLELLDKCNVYRDLWELDRSLNRFGIVDENNPTIGNLKNAG